MSLSLPGIQDPVGFTGMYDHSAETLESVYVTTLSAKSGVLFLEVGKDCVSRIEVHGDHVVIFYDTSQLSRVELIARSKRFGDRTKVTVGQGGYFFDAKEAAEDSKKRIKNRLRALKGLITKLSKRYELTEGLLSGDMLEEAPALLQDKALSYLAKDVLVK
jgi:hypothetical protein